MMPMLFILWLLSMLWSSVRSKFSEFIQEPIENDNKKIICPIMDCSRMKRLAKVSEIVLPQDTSATPVKVCVQQEEENDSVIANDDRVETLQEEQEFRNVVRMLQSSRH